jgi:hypothetical protein
VIREYFTATILFQSIKSIILNVVSTVLKVVVLLVGTNNVAHTPSHTAANIVEGIESIVWYINGINSSIKVLVLVCILSYFYGKKIRRDIARTSRRNAPERLKLPLLFNGFFLVRKTKLGVL